MKIVWCWGKATKNNDLNLMSACSQMHNPNFSKRPCAMRSHMT
jgi:hypothetical protein